MATILQLVSGKIRRSFMSEEMVRDTLLFRAFLILVVLVTVQLFFVGLYFSRLPDVIVLHSNIYFGIDLIGAKSYSLAIPLLAFSVSLVHLILARMLYARNKEISRVLVIGTIVIILFLSVNTFFLINLNT